MPEPHDSGQLSPLVTDFLAELAHTNRSRHTCRAYATDLAQFSAFYRGTVGGITAEVIRGFGATLQRLGPASRARKQAALASFLGWARRQGHLASDPMASVARVRPDPPRPRSLGRGPVEAILKVIPAAQRRDRLLFRLIFETGLRVSEALGVHLEDLDLATDDEHLSLLGKGGQRRTVLLDDAHLVRQLRVYLKQTGYRHGPLFRAAKNGRGGPLRYQSVQERWARYCAGPGCLAPSTSYATRTRRSWSTEAWVWRRSGSGWGTRTSRPRCGTPSNRTRRPTRRCGPGGGSRVDPNEPPASRLGPYRTFLFR